jgi:hypothetical protein
MDSTVVLKRLSRWDASVTESLSWGTRVGLESIDRRLQQRSGEVSDARRTNIRMRRDWDGRCFCRFD